MMRKAAWTGILAACLMAGASLAAPSTPIVVAEVQAALDKGDAGQAVNLAEGALKEGGLNASERARLLLYRGLAQELMGAGDAAVSDFTQALATNALPPEELKKLRRSVITFAGINLVIPFAVNYGADAVHAGLQIDYMAHVGGVACGLLFAAPMVPRLGSPRSLFLMRLRLAIGIVAGLLVLFVFFLAQLPR